LLYRGATSSHNFAYVRAFVDFQLCQRAEEGPGYRRKWFPRPMAPLDEALASALWHQGMIWTITLSEAAPSVVIWSSLIGSDLLRQQHYGPCCFVLVEATLGLDILPCGGKSA
jgi:hypothetical protein